MLFPHHNERLFSHQIVKHTKSVALISELKALPYFPHFSIIHLNAYIYKKHHNLSYMFLSEIHYPFAIFKSSAELNAQC